MRFDNSPELFGGGSGTSTGGKIKCGLCGTKHEGGNDHSVLTTEFAGIDIAECCFEKIEDEVLHRMPYILPWFIKILETRKKKNKINQGLINRIKKALDE